MLRRVPIILAAVVAVTASQLGAKSEASDGPGLNLEATAVASTGPSTGPPVCDPSGRCLVGYTLTTEFSGEMTGILTNVGALWLDTTLTYQATAIGLFSGEVEGCGAGTMALSFPLIAGGAMPTSGRVDVVPGSGTGALTGVSGSGAYTFTPTSQGSTSDVSLHLRCPPT